jgi:hypothetical protein
MAPPFFSILSFAIPSLPIASAETAAGTNAKPDEIMAASNKRFVIVFLHGRI